MSPARKKTKTEPADNEISPPITEPKHDDADNRKSGNHDKPTTNAGKEHTRTGSWYSTATSPWRSGASSKAAVLVAQVARESISVAQGVSSSSSEARQSGEIRSDEEGKARRPSQNVSKSFKGPTSRKSGPLVAEATKVHATSNLPSVPKGRKVMGEKSGRSKDASVQEEPKEVGEGERKEEVAEEAPLPPEPESQEMQEVDSKDDTKDADSASVRNSSGTWFGWWSRPDGYGSDVDKREAGKSATKVALDDAADEDATGTPLPGTPQDETAKSIAQPEATAQEEDTTGELQPEMSVNTGSGRSWFGLWSSKQNQQAVAEEQQRRESEQRDHTEEQPDVEVTAGPTATADDKTAAEVEAATEPKAKTKARDKDNEDERPRSSGWAFWSKEPAPSADLTQKQVGELAVADTPSQSHPEIAQFNEQRDGRKEEVTGKRNSSLLRLKRGINNRKSKDLSGETTAVPTPESHSESTPTASGSETPVEPPVVAAEVEREVLPQPRGKKAAARPNLILPSFRDTYPSASSPGIIDRLTSYVGQTLHISGYEPPRAANHPYVNPSPPKVRKAIAIGVHGFFPAAFLHRFVGQPTGTSIRFANYAAASIKSWCAEHQPEIKDLEVEKVSLEGEGYISSRVDTLWKLLLNWLSHLRSADFILIACHSQGVPVSIQLIAKLLQLGCLSPNVRIGVCAMAGINLGPFTEYKSRFLAGSASELFEFGDSSSKVSVAYADALDICLRHGVRITFVGSLDDQLVSLESALHAPVTHPYVSRTIFIDGRVHTSNFLIHLVVFAAKLRNLGVSDHGLLRELSSPLAGSIVGGEGHSRVYDDPAVYTQAIEFALESTDVLPPPVPPKGRQASADAATPADKRRSLDGDRRAGQAGYPKKHDCCESHAKR